MAKSAISPFKHVYFNADKGGWYFTGFLFNWLMGFTDFEPFYKKKNSFFFTNGIVKHSLSAYNFLKLALPTTESFQISIRPWINKFGTMFLYIMKRSVSFHLIINPEARGLKIRSTSTLTRNYMKIHE